MGLIMLILIGTVPTAYALNHTPAPNHVESFRAASLAAAAVEVFWNCATCDSGKARFNA